MVELNKFIRITEELHLEFNKYKVENKFKSFNEALKELLEHGRQ